MLKIFLVFFLLPIVVFPETDCQSDRDVRKMHTVLKKSVFVRKLYFPAYFNFRAKNFFEKIATNILV